jgi:hypothetical protein
MGVEDGGTGCTSVLVLVWSRVVWVWNVAKGTSIRLNQHDCYQSTSRSGNTAKFLSLLPVLTNASLARPLSFLNAHG